MNQQKIGWVAESVFRTIRTVLVTCVAAILTPQCTWASSIDHLPNPVNPALYDPDNFLSRSLDNVQLKPVQKERRKHSQKVKKHSHRKNHSSHAKNSHHPRHPLHATHHHSKTVTGTHPAQDKHRKTHHRVELVARPKLDSKVNPSLPPQADQDSQPDPSQAQVEPTASDSAVPPGEPSRLTSDDGNCIQDPATGNNALSMNQANEIQNLIIKINNELNQSSPAQK